MAAQQQAKQSQKAQSDSTALDFQSLLKKHRGRRIKPHKIYSVLAKDDVRWRTILSRTDDIDLARAMMDEANVSAGYKRIILCQATINPLMEEEEDIRWQTVECAIPHRRNMPTKSSDDIRAILRRLDSIDPQKQERPKHSFGRRPSENRSSIFVADKRQQNKPFSFLGRLGGFLFPFSRHH